MIPRILFQDWRLLLAALAGILLLSFFPLPHSITPFRPQWGTLILFYLGVFTPLYTGIIRSWLLGLITDILAGTLFGAHALIFAFVTLITLRFHLQLRNFPLLQQSIALAFIVAANLLLEYLLRSATQNPPTSWLFWSPILTTPLFWPVIYALLRRLQRS